MACPEPASSQETKFLSALRGANRFGVDGATLRLFSTGLPAPLRFTRTKPRTGGRAVSRKRPRM
jgi:hypothetical protein